MQADQAAARIDARRWFARAATPAALADRAEALLTRTQWVRDLLAPGLAALRADPLAQPAMATNRDRMRTGIVLLDTGRVIITANVIAAAAVQRRTPPASVIVPGRLTVTRYVRAAGARLHLWRAPIADAEFSAADSAPAVEAGTLALSDGQIVRLDGRQLGWWHGEATGDVVTISVTIRAGQGPLMRDYALPSGRLRHCATIDEGAARAQMLLTYLRAEQRREATPAFAAATRDPAAFLRWEAMRNWLALDARSAMSRLTDLAVTDEHPDIRAAAAQTLAAIADRYGERLCRG